MRATRYIASLTLLASGLSFGGVAYEKIVVPEPVCGPWYASVFGGGSFYDDGEITTNPAFGAPESGTYNFDNGWILGAAVGIATQNFWRFEVELSHHQAPGDTASETNGAVITPGQTLLGDVETTSVMFNIVKEFPGLEFWNLRPYLGAGVGLSNVNATNLVRLPGVNIDGGSEENLLGYQALAGLVYDLTQCVQIYAEYRLTGHGDSEDYIWDAAEFGSLDLGWQQHAIIGARWFF